jgi:hypothetical protein
MHKAWMLTMILALGLAACRGPAGSPSPTASPQVQLQPTDTASPSPRPAGETATASPNPPPAVEVLDPSSASFAGEPLANERDQFFAGSGVCAACHTNLQDASGQDVSISDFWRSSMMANAARDPYWQATVRSEIERQPAYSQVIVEKCATCHTPMASFSAQQTDLEVGLFETGFLSPEHPQHGLAIDGVSCTVCHQIENQKLGLQEGFSGGYVIDPDLPAGERISYGPYWSPPGMARTMQAVSGYTPAQGLHIQQSEQCATCHILYTPTIDDQGEISGELPEQMVYYEWLNSAYADRQSCQSCHMPEVSGSVALANTHPHPRSPFSKHEFVGGNTEILEIFLQHGEALGVSASSDQFKATLKRAQNLLQTQTASLAINNVEITGGQLAFQVQIANQAGHKLPSGYPSRRVWLHITVRDATGGLVFESGASNPDGSILGNDNDEQPAAFEPHYNVITEPGQVQIYEAIMTDTNGEVTTALLSGAGYVKDNRLLPEGFDRQAARAEIAVAGAAAHDENFLGGGDQVDYQLDLSGAREPVTIQVELLYQAIGYHWADSLAADGSAEVAGFQVLFAGLPHIPIQLAQAELVLEP